MSDRHNTTPPPPSDFAILLPSEMSAAQVKIELQTIDDSGTFSRRLRGYPTKEIINQHCYFAWRWRLVAWTLIVAIAESDTPKLYQFTTGGVIYCEPPLCQPNGFSGSLIYLDHRELKPVK